MLLPLSSSEASHVQSSRRRFGFVVALFAMSSFTDSIPSGSGQFNPRAYLAKFGYESGKGLGKKEDGMVKHISVSKKDDTRGVTGAPAGRWEECIEERRAGYTC